jgi:hypothetical protein
LGYLALIVNGPKASFTRAKRSFHGKSEEGRALGPTLSLFDVQELLSDRDLL